MVSPLPCQGRYTGSIPAARSSELIIPYLVKNKQVLLPGPKVAVKLALPRVPVKVLHSSPEELIAQAMQLCGVRLVGMASAFQAEIRRVRDPYSTP